MIEAVMLWNEPDKKSHWDIVQLDTRWQAFFDMVILAGRAVAAERPGLTRVLGGISPIDPDFIRRMQAHGVLEHIDAIAVHGFPLDRNHWHIDEWPAKIAHRRLPARLRSAAYAPGSPALR